jgi:hypothetical protein
MLVTIPQETAGQLDDTPRTYIASMYWESRFRGISQPAVRLFLYPLAR